MWAPSCVWFLRKKLAAQTGTRCFSFPKTVMASESLVKRSSLNPANHEVVHPSYLRYIKVPFYAYSGKDYSLSSKFFMQRYWTAVLQLVPRTMAPNMLTLLGFCCSCSMTALVTYFYSVSKQPCPQWVWLFSAVALFGYQTLDAIDGKQARRTQSGSALGELFDHGCDALFTPMLQVVVCLAVGYNDIQRTLHCCGVACGLFLSIFEQYCTGTLDLGYINGPVDGILIICSCLVWTSIAGTSWWTTPFAEPFVLEAFDVTIASFTRANDIVFVVCLIGIPVTAFSNLYHVITMPKAHEKINRVAAFFPQVAIFVALAALLSWRELASAWPFAAETAFGMFSSFTVTRLTISRLCRSPFRWESAPAIACLSLAAMSLVTVTLLSLSPATAVDVVGIGCWGTVIFILVCYVHMMLSVFTQFSTHLGVNLLTLTESQKQVACRVE